VKVQVRVEDGHGGRLEEEDELDPDEMLHPEVLESKFYNFIFRHQSLNKIR
jgi:hypothetical protein